MSTKYDYFAEVEEMTPPLNDYRFAAKVPYIVENPGPNFKRIYPGFSEHWGKTRQEAEQKALDEAAMWIAARPGSE